MAIPVNEERLQDAEEGAEEDDLNHLHREDEVEVDLRVRRLVLVQALV